MSTSDAAPADGANSTATPDSRLEQAYAALVEAINAQSPGAEARYLARLTLLLLSELQFSEAALRLIDIARESPDARSP